MDAVYDNSASNGISLTDTAGTSGSLGLVTGNSPGTDASLYGIYGTPAGTGTTDNVLAPALVGPVNTAATFNGTSTTGLVLLNPVTQNPLTVTSTGLIDVNSSTPNAIGILGNAGFNWTVVNQGTVESVGSLGVGVYLKTSGLVANGVSGATHALIDGSYAGLVISGGPGAVNNYGTIQGAGDVRAEGVILAAGGQVNNGVGGLIAGARNGVYVKPAAGAVGGTLINQGTVTAFGSLVVSGTVVTGIAAYLTAGSIVQNGQNGSSGGLIEGYYVGVRMGIPGVPGLVGTITNFGTINVVSTSGTLPFDIAVQGLARTDVVNFGTITALGQGGGVGIQLPLGGSVQNGATNDTTAVISAYIHAIGVGYNSTATVVNFGTLESTQFGVVRKDTGATLLFHYAGSLVNYGLVQGQLASVWTGMNGTKSSFAGTGTIVNFGTISELNGLQQGIYARAVYLHGGGLVVNGQSVFGGGLIKAGGDAIIVNQPGEVRNFGTIDSLALTAGNPGTLTAAGIVLTNGGVIENGATNSPGALIQAYEAPVYVGGYRGNANPGAVGTVKNFGTIAGVATGTLAESSITFITDGTVVNYGLIASAGSTGISFLLTPGTITNLGTITSTSTADAGIDLHAGGLVTNTGGLIAGLHDGIRVGGTTGQIATISNSGTISGATGICINPADNGGNTIINYGTIIGSGGTAINLGTLSSALIVLGSAANLQGVVSNMIVGDAFDLPFLTFSNSGTATLGANNVLQVIEPSGTVSIALDPNESFAGTVFNTSSDSGTGTLVTEQVNPCFCRGTLILTERGEVPVEDLVIGERVVTLSGRLQAIRWIGRRAYDGRFVADNRTVLPIRIAAGALAVGVPVRDLWLSPEHALYVDGVLVAAQLLVDGTVIRQIERVEHLEYFHVELEHHDVILAEGTPVESYVECDNRGVFQNVGEFALLYPDDGRSRQFCAPRIELGADQLTSIREAIACRTVALDAATAASAPISLAAG